MYRIMCDGVTLFEPDNPALQIITGNLKTGINLAGTLTFTVSPTHPYRDRIRVRASVIDVYRDDVLYFRGSPISVAENDLNIATVTVEGALGYLNDSVQPCTEYHDMPLRTYLETLIDNHNAQVDTFKQFSVGTVTVTDTNDSLYRQSNYEHTKAAIADKLVSRLGGYLRVRWVSGVQYLDYLADYENVNAQGVHFGRNLLTYAKSLPSSSLATAIIPLGAKLGDSEERLQINIDGRNYVYDADAVEAFGWIFDTIICDDVTLVDNLVKRGYSELEARRSLPATIKLTAVDFGALDGSYARITVGDLLPVTSAPHNLDTYMIVSEMVEDLIDPGRSTVTLGASYSTLTSHQVSQKPASDGKDGEDATVLRIDSSRGTVFKNAEISTVLTVTIHHGDKIITNRAELTEAFGAAAYLEWSWKRMDDQSFGVISASDSRLSNDGFALTLSPDDIDTKAVFMCKLDV